MSVRKVFAIAKVEILVLDTVRSLLHWIGASGLSMVCTSVSKGEVESGRYACDQVEKKIRVNLAFG